MSERITITDARRLYCVDGCVEWLRLHGFNVRDAIRNGIDVDDERIAGDGHVPLILAAKRKGSR